MVEMCSQESLSFELPARIFNPKLFRMEQKYFPPNDITQSRNCRCKVSVYSFRRMQDLLWLKNGPPMKLLRHPPRMKSNSTTTRYGPMFSFSSSQYRRAGRLPLPHYLSRNYQSKDLTEKTADFPRAANASLAIMKL